MGDKISAADREKVEAELAKLKKAMADNDMDQIRRFMEDVRQASYKMSEELYKNVGSSGAQGGGGQQSQGEAGGPRRDDDVIDADFRTMDN